MIKTVREKLNLFETLYFYSVEICVTNSIENERNSSRDVTKFNSKLKGSVAGLLSYNTETGESTMYIHVDSEAGLIAHEAWHCVYRMFEYIGASMENELVAHHIEYIVNQVNRLMKRKKK